jgi:hypothetical protein
MMLVTGESGVGKSALVRRFTEGLGGRALVLMGRCYERESVPYKAFDGIVDALSRHLSRLPFTDAAALLPLKIGLVAQVFPVLRRVEAIANAPMPRDESRQVDPLELRARLFAALRELLARLAQRTPLVLVVDDLQWADHDSLLLLGEVLQPPDAPPLVLIATTRDGDATAAARIAGEVRRLPIARLPFDEARALAGLLLARARGGADDHDDAESIAEEARGHPLFIDELVRHAALSDDARPAELKLDEALVARITRLDEPARRLLELLAVAGGPLDQETAARAAAIDFGELARHASLLRVANLVRSTGGRATDTLEPYHDRVREAILSHLTVDERRARHERLAVALEASARAVPEALAAHWEGAGAREKAAPHALVAAARAAEALAFDRAAELYRLRLTLAPADGDEGRQLWTHLGDALANAGRSIEAAQAYIEAAAGAAPDDALELSRRAAEELLISGHVDEGLAVLRSVLAEAGLSLPSTNAQAVAELAWLRARLFVRGRGWRARHAAQISRARLARIDICWSVGIGMALIGSVRGAVFLSRALLLALSAGEPARVARALCAEHVYHAALGHAPTRLDELEALAQRVGTPREQALATMARALCAFLVGEWGDARLLFERAEGELRDRCTGVTWELDTVRLLALNSLYYLGELRELSMRVPAQLREANERGDLFMATNLRIGAPSVVWLAADDADGARREARDAMAHWSDEGFHTQHTYALVAEVQAELYAGDGRAALAQLRARWPALVASQQLRVQLVRVVMLELRARAAIALATTGAPSERAPLVRAAAADARAIADEHAPWARALAQLLDAAILAARGAPVEQLAAALDAAARALDRAHLALHAAAARRRRGALLAGDEGRALVAAVDRWLTDERVRDPARFTAMLAPGWRA